MTTEEPRRLTRRPPRPSQEFRRAALGVTAHHSPVDGVPPRVPGVRESLTESLARIPDLEPAGDRPTAIPWEPAVPSGAAPAVAEAASGAASEAVTVSSGSGRGLVSLASRLVNGRLPDDYLLEDGVDDVAADDVLQENVVVADETPSSSEAVDSTTAPSTGPLDLEDLFVAVASVPGSSPSGVVADGELGDAPGWLREAADEEARIRASRALAPVTVPRWRRVLFAITVVLLVAAVPALSYTGFQLVSESTDGQMVSNTKTPQDPGYEEEVISTPTQLVLQVDGAGRPVAATVLSLSGASGGGSVIYVPLNTEVHLPAYGVDRIIGAYNVLEPHDPALGREMLAGQVAITLNAGIDSVVEMDDRGWARLVEPVAPLRIANPEPIEVNGEVIDSGTVELAADQVGPYLAAEVPGESPFSRSLRHELVWEAWLSAVAESGNDAITVERSAGIGRFIAGLAAGPVDFSTVPVTADPEIDGLLRVDGAALGDIMLAAVPMPDSPAPGARPTVRLLNGVAPEPIPASVLQTVVQVGGAITSVGNGPSFGRSETTITYSNPDNEGYAELLAVALGGGNPRLDPEALDSVGLTVILGSDVLDGASDTTTEPATTRPTTTTVPGDSEPTDTEG